RPQVLFLDEPTTGLAPEVRAGMWAEIAHLSAGEGPTILLTTHYLEEADRLAGRLAIVHRGWEVAVDGRSLRARTGDGSAAVPAVLQALEAGGVRVASVTIARPSLDDVYLPHTGARVPRTEEPV